MNKSGQSRLLIVELDDETVAALASGDRTQILRLLARKSSWRFRVLRWVARLLGWL